MRRTISIPDLTERDALLLKELNECSEASRCAEISQSAEDKRLAYEAHRKCVRIYRWEEHLAGSL
jgi:hypothetical protein